jgi:hypothetical protein
MFQNVSRDIDEFEIKSTKALQLLAQSFVSFCAASSKQYANTYLSSVRALPRFSAYTGNDSPASISDLRAMAELRVKKWQEENVTFGPS